MELGKLFGIVCGKVVSLCPVVRRVELPNVVGDIGSLTENPGDAVAGHRGPALVVYAPVYEHLEILCLALVVGTWVIE